MKNTLILAFAALLSVPLATLAQEPNVAPIPPAANPVVLEDPDSSSAAAAAPQPDSLVEPAKAEAWRAEVLGWKDAHRVEEGTESGAISEMNRAVIVLGKVNGDISVVSGDVAVLGEVNGNVSAVSGTVTVLGTINGKASVVDGNLRVAGKITGETAVVGGAVETAPSNEPPPESSNTETASSAASPPVAEQTKKSGWFKGDFKFDGGHFTLNFNGDNRDGGKNSGIGGVIKGFWLSPFMLIWRSALLILWVALSCAVAALFHPNIRRAQVQLRLAAGRSAAFGFLWGILFWMLLVGGIILSLMFIGIPFLIVLIAFDLALSAFGMTLVFSVVGEWLARRWQHPNPSLYAAVFVGACFLGLLRLVPIFGSLIWFIAGLFGVGAALVARFGIEGQSPQPTALPPMPAT